MAKVELKQPIVNEIAEAIKDAQSVVLVDHRGLTVAEDTELRRQLRKAGVTYKVYKNTMMHFAFKGTDCVQLGKYLEGPSALVVSKTDATAPAREIVNFAKKAPKLEVKGGIVEGQLYDAAGLEEVAKVPSKEELQTYRKLFPDLRVPNRKFGNTLVYIDECPELKGIRVLRTGLHLAECRGNVLIPDHAAALCPRSGTAPVTELPTEKVPEYIAGLESEGRIKGWTLMQYKGLRLGWGKGNGSSVKNHYPKGLRKNRIATEL